MKKSLLAVAATILAVTAATSTSAIAQGWQPGPYDHQPGYQHQQQPGGHERRYEPSGHAPARHADPQQGHGWRTGGRLPPEWRVQRYVIAKPAVHHLHRPPPGHRWIRAGHDAVLVVARTGIIVEIVPGLFR